jgi:hypothetical protein
LRDKNEAAVAVFKPIDEEPFAPNNPRGRQAPFGSETVRAGVRSGELTVREVIAYLLDHEGFADVPATTLVSSVHPAFRYTEFETLSMCNLNSGISSDFN